MDQCTESITRPDLSHAVEYPHARKTCADDFSNLYNAQSPPRLGPSLFLMSTKAFAWFFLAITVLNIPVIAFFASGNQAGDFNSLPDVFAILSMGNVGQSGFACNSVKMEEFYERDPKAFGYSPREQLQQYQRYSAININCG